MRILLLFSLFLYLTSCKQSVNESASKQPDLSCSSSISKIEIIDGEIFMQCSINERYGGNFMFDTGSSLLSLDSVYYHNTLCKEDTFTLIKNQETLTTSENSVLKFKSGGVTFNYSNAIELFNLNLSGAKKTDGIIGMLPFVHKYIYINYEDSTFRTAECKDDSLLSGYFKTELQNDHLIPLINLTVYISPKDSISGLFLFDTGFNGSIILTNCAGKYSDISGISYRKTSSNLYNTPSSGNIIRAKSARLFHKEIKNVVVLLSNDTIGLLANTPFVGIVGNDILSHFNYAIQLNKEELYIKPNKHFKSAQPDWIGLSFSVIDKRDTHRGLMVNCVYGDDNDADIMLGDIIVNVDGTSVMNLEKKAFMNYLRSRKIT